jgi:hypothetical protein
MRYNRCAIFGLKNGQELHKPAILRNLRVEKHEKCTSQLKLKNAHNLKGPPPDQETALCD